MTPKLISIMVLTLQLLSVNSLSVNRVMNAARGQISNRANTDENTGTHDKIDSAKVWIVVMIELNIFTIKDWYNISFKIENEIHDSKLDLTASLCRFVSGESFGAVSSWNETGACNEVRRGGLRSSDRSVARGKSGRQPRRNLSPGYWHGPACPGLLIQIRTF